MRKFWLSMLFLATAATAVMACASGKTLELSGGWVRAMPPGMHMTAAFGKLKNVSDQSIQLKSFTSPSWGDVSLHRTVEVDGMSQMREVVDLTLQAGEELIMEPGGYHLMLMAPESQMTAGDSLQLSIETAGGEKATFLLEVRRR